MELKLAGRLVTFKPLIVKSDAATKKIAPGLAALVASSVMVGWPLLVGPLIVIWSRVIGAKRDVSAMVAPASAPENVMVMTPVPVALLAASSASRSEMPSPPGLAISAHGLDVS